jgi:hypothetical protein
MRYHDKVGAHPRERRRHPCSQCPTGDEAGKPDADPESYCKNQKDRPQPSSADVLRRQPY